MPLARTWLAAGLLAALLAPLIALPCSARASGGDALKLFREGVALIRADKIAEAEKKLQASWDLFQAYDTAANLAECEVKLGQKVEAAEHIDFAVRNLPNHVDDALRAELTKRSKEIRAEVAALSIGVEPAGAAVRVGTRDVGTSPLPADVFVEPGEVRVAATLPDGASGEASVRVTKGERREVRIAISERAAPPAPLPGGVGKASPPPAPPTEAPPSESGGGSPAAWPGLVIGGVGLASMGVGIGLLVAGGAGLSDAEDNAASLRAGGTVCSDAGTGSPACDQQRADIDSADGLRTGGAVALTVGGAATAAGAGYLIWALTAGGTKADSAWAPTAGPGQLGLGWRHGF